MKSHFIEASKSLAVIIGGFILVGSVAPAEAIPIEPANSPIYSNDSTYSGGLDYSSKAAKYVEPKKGKNGLVCPHETKLIGRRCLVQPGIDQYTGYVQGAVRTGGNTAIFGGYDTNGQTLYGGVGAKLGNAAVTVGYDGKPTGMVAYSLGALSPFAAYQRGKMHYGADFRLSEYSAVNVSYRDDGAVVAGIRVDFGTGSRKAVEVPVKPPAVEPAPYYETIPVAPETDVAPAPPVGVPIRGRG